MSAPFFAAAIVLMMLVACQAPAFSAPPGAASSSRPEPTASTTPDGPGHEDGELEVGGQTRQYRVAFPSSPSGGRLPLLLVFHPKPATPLRVAGQTGFDSLAEAGEAIVAYPDGIFGSWNAGACCEPATTDGVDDLAYVNALIDRLEASYRIDRHRIYATGWSNGGEMTYAVGCALSERLAGIAVVAGSLITDCDPSSPLSVLAIHGTYDTFEPYDGGEGYEGIDYPSFADEEARWRKINGCEAEPELSRARSTRISTSNGCTRGTRVVFVTVEGGGHIWFTSAPDASVLVWAFLRDERRALPPGDG
jgi:polyhydroxybutyrate depolymerase